MLLLCACHLGKWCDNPERPATALDKDEDEDSGDDVVDVKDLLAENVTLVVLCVTYVLCVVLTSKYIGNFSRLVYTQLCTQ